MNIVMQNIGLAIVIAVTGGVVGILLILGASLILPRLIERVTPNIDDEKELARGNVAVGQFFGRVVAACIMGISIVIAAAVLGGIIAALH